MRTLQAKSDIEALGLAKEPTPALVQNACSSFAEMLAHMTGQKVTVWIDNVPIARNPRQARA
ncbi:hypothetical protein CBA19CS22_37950 [Caballeronia novacaledonica]|uniref:Uncharacterized protein n=1 Tax=Caballeronia novacaledonica TaxID=1544861 RepID=A0ACB5R521_9BURK|nr:hypothetical protein CBA19CS22_37950 [Caballeronia novacaledonica]